MTHSCSLDAIKIKSKLFTFALPCAYILYVAASYILIGYFFHLNPLFHQAGGNGSQVMQYASGLTFEGQITGSLSTLMFLMIGFLYSSLKDSTGEAVLFPLRIVTVMKSAVPFILDTGVWMKAVVNEELEQVVLVRKRTLAPGDTEDDGGWVDS